MARVRRTCNDIECAIDVLQGAELNPGFFFFCLKTFLRIIFSVIFKSIQSSTC